MTKSWTVTIEEDKETGELILPFNDEILKQLKWKEGDTLEWVDNKDGSWSLVKKKEKKKEKIVAKSKTI
jgi:bifunctional DNA-binding transcriptional regulator/antitoxin component of YhaV-PrlF toxin-antitoxin module